MIRDAYILWPTIRPNWCANALKRAPGSWLNLADQPQNIIVKIAVNVDAQKAEVLSMLAGVPNVEVLVVGNTRSGATYPTSILAKSFQAKPEDIVILASDDFRPIKSWNTWMAKHFDGFDGCLLVNDGYQTEPSVTLPIMTYNCLLRLNRVIYHPAYHHMFSDTELYDVLAELGLLKNLRRLDQPTFEHVHWAANKRPADGFDERTKALAGVDRCTYYRRRGLPLAEKLKT